MKRHLCAFLFALSSLPFLLNGAVQAQTPSLVTDQLRTTIAKTIGAQADSVEIAVRESTLTVLRVNSNMNQSTHGGRDNEANAIGPIVAKAIAGSPDFKNLHTIRVQYVIRSTPGTTDKVIDTIDFRETPSGSFEFHKT
ncbi:MAG TPA: hypothetical protein VFB45_22355 [Pseudolabrys sp.]|nr:hypothetical protein [Pseudolabrys sp.]